MTKKAYCNTLLKELQSIPRVQESEPLVKNILKNKENLHTQKKSKKNHKQTHKQAFDKLSNEELKSIAEAVEISITTSSGKLK